MSEEKTIQEQAEVLVKKIFYSPATNGRAEDSIKEGVTAVLGFARKVSDTNVQLRQGHGDTWDAAVKIAYQQFGNLLGLREIEKEKVKYFKFNNISLK